MSSTCKEEIVCWLSWESKKHYKAINQIWKIKITKNSQKKKNDCYNDTQDLSCTISLISPTPLQSRPDVTSTPTFLAAHLRTLHPTDFSSDAAAATTTTPLNRLAPNHLPLRLHIRHIAVPRNLRLHLLGAIQQSRKLLCPHTRTAQKRRLYQSEHLYFAAHNVLVSSPTPNWYQYIKTNTAQVAKIPYTTLALPRLLPNHRPHPQRGPGNQAVQDGSPQSLHPTHILRPLIKRELWRGCARGYGHSARSHCARGQEEPRALFAWCGGKRWYAGSCQICADWRKCYHSDYEWETEHGNVAGYLVFRVPRLEAYAQSGGYDSGREDVERGWVIWYPWLDSKQYILNCDNPNS